MKEEHARLCSKGSITTEPWFLFLQSSFIGKDVEGKKIEIAAV